MIQSFSGIYFYADNMKDAKKLEIVIGQLQIILKKKGLDVNIGISSDLTNKDDLVIFYVSDNITDEDTLKILFDKIISGNSKIYVCCWPYSNVRPLMDKQFSNLGSNLEDIASWLFSQYEIKNKMNK